MELQNYLYHHGIKGQKWGIRRFQNEDGSYTKEGLARRKEQEKEFERFTGKNAIKNVTQMVEDISDQLHLTFGKELIRARKELEESVIDRVDMLPKEKQDLYVSIGKETIDMAFKVLDRTEDERREEYELIKDLAETSTDSESRYAAQELLNWYGPGKKVRW